MLAIITAASYAYPIPFWILQKWGFLIFFTIFCGYMAWYIFSQDRDNRKLRDNRPSIDVATEEKLVPGGQVYYLRVSNKGAEGIFRTQIRLSSAEPSVHRLPHYNGYWEYGNKDETKILKGHDDLIKIAESIASPPHYDMIHLNIFFYDTKAGAINSIAASSHPISAFVTYKDGSTKPLTKWDYKLHVTISSSPELREGVFHGDYILNVDGLRSI